MAVLFTGEYLTLVGTIDPVLHPDGGLDEDAMMHQVIVAIAESVEGDGAILYNSLDGILFSEDGGVVTFSARFHVSEGDTEEETSP